MNKKYLSKLLANEDELFCYVDDNDERHTVARKLSPSCAALIAAIITEGGEFYIDDAGCIFIDILDSTHYFVDPDLADAVRNGGYTPTFSSFCPDDL